MQNILSNSNVAISNDKIIEEISLENEVKRSISMHTEFRYDQIVTQSNVEKYFDRNNPHQENEYLNQVVEAMAGLNKEGMNSPNLGRVSKNGSEFSATLKKTCEWFAATSEKKTIVYVELGPEPVKTSRIIGYLLENDIQIEHYVAVDINPASEKYMRPAIEKLLPNSKLSFVTSSFEEFQLAEFLENNSTPAFITMLGFQEGNDDPEIMTKWLAGIARSGDFLLSEVQLYNFEKAAKISNFYAHPLMQKFSRIAFEQYNGPALSSNRFFLLPVKTRSRELILVAILAEEFLDEDRVRKLFVSNFCLKFTELQYANYRQMGNQFKILNKFDTEDNTLQFQISKRCMNE